MKLVAALVVVALGGACGTASVTGRDCPTSDQLVAGTSLACGGRQIEGALLRGDLPECSAALLTNCVTTAPFAAADVARLVPENIRIKATVAGVTGTLAPRVVSGNYPLCAQEGQADCIAVVDFVAVDTTSLAAKIAVGQSVGTVVGQGVPQPAKPCTNNVQVGCYTHDLYVGTPSKDVAQCLLSNP